MVHLVCMIWSISCTNGEDVALFEARTRSHRWHTYSCFLFLVFINSNSNIDKPLTRLYENRHPSMRHGWRRRGALLGQEPPGPPYRAPGRWPPTASVHQHSTLSVDDARYHGCPVSTCKPHLCVGWRTRATSRGALTTPSPHKVTLQPHVAMEYPGVMARFNRTVSPGWGLMNGHTSDLFSFFWSSKTLTRIRAWIRELSVLSTLSLKLLPRPSQPVVKGKLPICTTDGGLVRNRRRHLLRRRRFTFLQQSNVVTRALGCKMGPGY